KLATSNLPGTVATALISRMLQFSRQNPKMSRSNGPPPKPQVGIALSGGGHRASLMALGALLYAVDAGIKDVNTISSVSGGSITNAFVAQECDFRKVRGFEQLAHKLANAIVHRGVLDSTLISRYYLAVLAGMTVLTLWSFSRFSTNFFPWWTCVLSMIGLILLTTLRGALIEYLFGAVLFRKGGRATTLGDIGGTTKHVLCATELVDAIPYYFVTGPEGYARGFVTRPYVQHMGEETHSVPEVKLQTAVRASA